MLKSVSPSANSSNKAALFQTLCTPYFQDFINVQDRMQLAMQSEDEQIQDLAKTIKKAPGKQLRPLLAILCARSFGDLNDEVLDYAAAVELVHNASLVHDDIIDDANFRRGQTTSHKQWGKTQAVLLGDFLFSVGYRLVLKTSDPKCRDDLPRVASLMCESELLQSDMKFKSHINRDTYYQIIKGKTAYLFGIAASAGCRLSGGSPDQAKYMEDFGTLLGMTFQIMDDWQDYAKSGQEDKKPRGADISMGTFTLPIICLLEEANVEEKELLKNALIDGDHTGLDSNFLINLNEKYNIKEKVLQTAKSFIFDAEAKLKDANSQNDPQHLLQLTNFVLSQI